MTMRSFLYTAIALMATAAPLAHAQAPATAEVVLASALEERPDKLTYTTKAKQPFTGTAVVKDTGKVDRILQITPYENGVRHGTEKFLNRKGVMKNEIDWSKGVRVVNRLYYSDGTLKAEFSTNPEGLPNGPHKRYHPNGKLMTENALLPDVVISGLSKDYDVNGELLGEYRFERSKLKEIISETPAGKAKREAAGIKLVP